MWSLPSTARRAARAKRRADRVAFARLRGEAPPPNSESSSGESGKDSEDEDGVPKGAPRRGEWMTKAPTDRHGLGTLLTGGPESAVAQHRQFSRYGQSGGWCRAVRVRLTSVVVCVPWFWLGTA